MAASHCRYHARSCARFAHPRTASPSSGRAPWTDSSSGSTGSTPPATGRRAELGADDYICKPFSPREVVARVKAVLRRSGCATLQAAGLVLDDARHRATLNGRDLELTAVEFKLLRLLASPPARIFGRQQLMDRIYPDERIVSDRTIDSHIKKLRKKVAAAAPGSELIHSVYGLGYKFEEKAE